MDNVGGGEVESGSDNRVSDGTAPQLFTCLPQRIRSSARKTASQMPG